MLALNEDLAAIHICVGHPIHVRHHVDRPRGEHGRAADHEGCSADLSVGISRQLGFLSSVRGPGYRTSGKDISLR